MTTKPAAPNGRDDKMLEAVRKLFRDGSTFGPEIPPLAQAAGRAPGFGTDAIDVKIRNYLDGTYGVGRWQRDRDPYKWEKGGGDEKLDQLFAEEDGLFTEFQRLEAAMWTARDELSAGRRQDSVSAEVVALLTKNLDAALKAWQKAKLALEACKGRRSERQLWLQENYRRALAGK